MKYSFLKFSCDCRRFRYFYHNILCKSISFLFAILPKANNASRVSNYNSVIRNLTANNRSSHRCPSCLEEHAHRFYREACRVLPSTYRISLLLLNYTQINQTLCHAIFYGSSRPGSLASHPSRLLPVKSNYFRSSAFLAAS